MAADNAAPARALERQLSAPGRRDTVVLRALIVVGELPLRVDPALPLETMQRWIEGTVIDVEHFIGAGAERNADTVAVLRSPLQGAQNQQVERALEQIRLLSRLGHRQEAIYHHGRRLSTTWAGRGKRAVSRDAGFQWEPVVRARAVVPRRGQSR